MKTSQPWLPLIVVLATILVGAARSAPAIAGADEPSPAEQPLLAILRSDAPAATKAVTCKKLAIHGSSAAVADLAPLLQDPQLASWARIALEAIPGPDAANALREATASLQGKLLIGVLNSLGVRRDAQAVELLTTHLASRDDDVAAAAAVALGQVGSGAAIASLKAALDTANQPVRSAVAEGLVVCAEQLAGGGDLSQAVALYDQVRQAEVPQQRIIEATRGAILARRQAGIPLLVEQFRSPDKRFFQLGLMVAREFSGSEIDAALAAELRRAAPARAALLVRAMADRKETVDVAAILDAASDGPKQVRLAAIDALGTVGDVSCLAPLLDIATGADAELAKAAKTTLFDLPGEGVDARIVALLPTAEGMGYPLLIELVGARRINAVGILREALQNQSPEVRHAALKALGETVMLADLDELIAEAVSPRHPADAATARLALRAAAVRMPDREACATQLATALATAPSTATTPLLETLAEVGGTKSLQTLGAAAKSDDDQQQDAASRLLGKWNGVEAAPVLLDLAQHAPSRKYQIRALRGYLGLARKFAMPEQQRVDMCRQAYMIATQPAEQQLVLDVLTLHPSPAALRLAIHILENDDLKASATQAALVIAQKIGSQGTELRKLLDGAGLARVKLEIVKAEYGNGSTQRDVTATVRKHAGSLPVITLPEATYNASLGGDPAPGIVKRLKIQYRIDGKAGEATFAENALILLPIPK